MVEGFVRGIAYYMNKKETGIKICGLTDPIEAEYLNEFSVDYAGFVFYEKSKRNISFERAEEIFKVLDQRIKRVAVVVSPDERIIEDIMKHDFDIIQIHKELSEQVLKTAFLPIWYAINISGEDELCEKQKFFEMIEDKYPGKVNGILLDAPLFGSGKPFDWRKSKRLLKAGDRSSPFKDKSFILAGGLNSSNVAEGIRLFDPDIVDVSSSVEGSNGKDRNKIMDFVNEVRNFR